MHGGNCRGALISHTQPPVHTEALSILYPSLNAALVPVVSQAIMIRVIQCQNRAINHAADSLQVKSR